MFNKCQSVISKLFLAIKGPFHKPLEAPLIALHLALACIIKMLSRRDRTCHTKQSKCTVISQVFTTILYFVSVKKGP